jgi:glycosyltransferase involved in cell wall biosynthesis
MIDEVFEQVHLPDILAKHQVDLYFNPTFAIPSIKTTALQAAIIHDVVFEDHPEWVDPSLGDYLRRVSRFSVEHADAIVTVSNFSKSRICDVYHVGTDRITCIHNGLPSISFDHPNDQDMTSAREMYSLDKPFILCVSSLEVKKGIRELINAFSLLVDEGFPGQLLLSGSQQGSGFDISKIVAQCTHSERVVILGYVDQRYIKPLMLQSSLVVYPSLYEGFGMPPLEAMALGVPCLVHDGTSLPEVVGNCCLTTDVTDVKAFAHAMAQGLADGDFRTRAHRDGPIRARTHFHQPDLGELYLDLFDSMNALVL